MRPKPLQNSPPPLRHTVEHLRRRLRQAAQSGHRNTAQRFSREPVRSLGVRTPEIRRLAKEAAREYRSRRLPWAAILRLAEGLWKRETIEERSLAIEILSCFRSRFGAQEWLRFDRWVDSLSNWGETDGLCIYLLAPLLARKPALAARLPRWARSPNRWRRRAAAAALAPLARRGSLLEVVFSVCDRLGSDGDDLVEKAAGWLLKEASRTRPAEVVQYLLDNKSRLSRTTLRHACEKLPERARERVLA